MKVLLPYLIGAASAFVVQFLIQFYVVPRVETRKQLEERWVKDVLDLGELLTTSLEQLAKEAWEAQQSVRVMKNFAFGPEYDKAKVERELRERELAARQATWALRDFVNSRVSWVADRIIALSRNADPTVDLFRDSYQYRLKLLKYGPHDYEDLAEGEFDAFWDSERELRFELTRTVKKLSYLPRPPRAFWRRKLRSLRRKIARRHTVKPGIPAPAQAPAKSGRSS
ncbi:MAG: hypothetical protein JO345_33245 [Streptosporangiaceae bacterium]|nr:hypothetical protein [Streptosporangiaceae bacterium]